MKEKVSNECATILRTAKSRKVVVVYLQQILKIKVKQCKRQAHRLHVPLLLLHYVHAADNHNLTDTHINTHFEMWANILMTRAAATHAEQCLLKLERALIFFR
jgi:acyl CoA:acetate/3-ketoacid CoA transferase